MMHEKKKKTNSKHKKKKPVKEPPKQEPKIEEKKEEPIEDADKTASSSECSEDSGDEIDNERKKLFRKFTRARSNIAWRWCWLQLQTQELSNQIKLCDEAYKKLRESKQQVVPEYNPEGGTEQSARTVPITKLTKNRKVSKKSPPAAARSKNVVNEGIDHPLFSLNGKRYFEDISIDDENPKKYKKNATSTPKADRLKKFKQLRVNVQKSPHSSPSIGSPRMKKSRSRAHFDFDNVVIPINFMPVSPAPSPLAPPKDIHTPKWSIVSDYDSYFTEDYKREEGPYGTDRVRRSDSTNDIKSSTDSTLPVSQNDEPSPPLPRSPIPLSASTEMLIMRAEYNRTNGSLSKSMEKTDSLPNNKEANAPKEPTVDSKESLDTLVPYAESPPSASMGGDAEPSEEVKEPLDCSTDTSLEINISQIEDETSQNMEQLIDCKSTGDDTSKPQKFETLGDLLGPLRDKRKKIKVEGESSEEDTSDEMYVVRHFCRELLERKRYLFKDPSIVLAPDKNKQLPAAPEDLPTEFFITSEILHRRKKKNLDEKALREKLTEKFQRIRERYLNSPKFERSWDEWKPPLSDTEDHQKKKCAKQREAKRTSREVRREVFPTDEYDLMDFWNSEDEEKHSEVEMEIVDKYEWTVVHKTPPINPVTNQERNIVYLRRVCKKIEVPKRKSRDDQDYDEADAEFDWDYDDPYEFVAD